MALTNAERCAKWRNDHPGAKLASNRRYSATPEGKAAQARTATKRYAAGVERLAAVKVGGCVDGPDCDGPLHFHHLIPSEKLHSIAHMGFYSDATFFAELIKCVLVCRKHHFARHAEMRAAAQKELTNA